MTYLQFHLLFIFPPIVLMAVLLGRVGAPAREALLGGRWRWALPVLALIAFTYTTPWDNYLVWREVWWYGPDRVVGTIGYVPIEEYLFFLLQPFLTGLFTYHILLHGQGAKAHGLAEIPGLRLEPLPRHRLRVRLAGALPWFALSALGFWLLTFDAGTYMGLILSWASPVVGAMWLFMGPQLWRRVHVMGLAVGIPTLYLWVADTIAIRQGIWTITPRFTLGPAPFGLPVEEATFFLVTNVLVVVGTLLFLIPGMGEANDAEHFQGTPHGRGGTSPPPPHGV